MEYVSMLTRLSTSLNLGVSPALTTLSLHAIHSMISPATYACGSFAAM